MDKDTLSHILISDTPHFEASTEIEVYDPDEEVWNQLGSTTHTVGSLLDAINTDQLRSSWVRFVDETSRKYIRHLMNSPIDDELLNHPQVDQSTVVALADEGYMTVDALLNADDVVDIGKETGIDRNLVASISADFVDAFSTASFESDGVLSGLSPEDEFTGWHLVHETDERIVWGSDGGFRVSIASDLSDDVMIQTNTPDSDRHPWFRKGYELTLSTDDADFTAKEALAKVHTWLGENELTFEDDLTQIKHIGPATRDYFRLKYEIKSIAELSELCRKRGEMELIFGENFPEMIQSVEDVSGAVIASSQ